MHFLRSLLLGDNNVPSAQKVTETRTTHSLPIAIAHRRRFIENAHHRQQKKRCTDLICIRAIALFCKRPLSINHSLNRTVVLSIFTVDTEATFLSFFYSLARSHGRKSSHHANTRMDRFCRRMPQQVLWLGRHALSRRTPRLV